MKIQKFIVTKDGRQFSLDQKKEAEAHELELGRKEAFATFEQKLKETGLHDVLAETSAGSSDAVVVWLWSNAGTLMQVALPLAASYGAKKLPRKRAAKKAAAATGDQPPARRGRKPATAPAAPSSPAAPPSPPAPPAPPESVTPPPPPAA